MEYEFAWTIYHLNSFTGKKGGEFSNMSRLVEALQGSDAICFVIK